jgi:hypothetical protein
VVGWFYISWGTAVLFVGALGLLFTAMLIGRVASDRQRWAMALGGLALFGAYLVAVLVGPGRAITIHDDITTGGRSIEHAGVGYGPREECEDLQDLRRDRVKLPLRTIGHMIGLLGGPRAMQEAGAGPRSPIYLQLGDSCYEEWYQYGI